MLKIAGVCPLYNVLSAQYPFVEAIITTLPLVDVLFVNDGGSTDGTLEVLERMAKKWPKIQITRYPYTKSDFWETIDRVLEKQLAEHCQGYDWIIEVQADEYFHPRLYDATLAEIEMAHRNGYNALRQPITTIYRWENEDTYTYRNVRIFRNLPNIRSRWGGDCWYFEGMQEYREGFSAHNLPPEYDSSILRHHLKDCFKKDRALQSKQHAEFFAVKQDNRREMYEQFKDVEMPIKPAHEVNIHPEVPEIFHGLVGLDHYIVRDELFE